MSNRPAAVVRGPSRGRTARGFTLIQLLVAIGIIALLIAIAAPMIARAKRSGVRIRMAADLASISIALDAYKADFGDYPRILTPNNGEYINGAQLLCRALIGPAPEVDRTHTPASPPPAGQGFAQDGSDGPGFRPRAASPGANGGWDGWQVDNRGDDVHAQGRVYGPYVDISKFHFGDPSQPDNKGANPLKMTFLDPNNQPILYIPAAAGARPDIHKECGYLYVPPSPAFPKPTFNNPVTVPALYDVYDYVLNDDPADKSSLFNFLRRQGETDNNDAILRIRGFLGDTDDTTKPGPPVTGGIGGISPNETPATTGPYLLWTAGPDGRFFPDTTPASGSMPAQTDLTKCDDVTNFSVNP